MKTFWLGILFTCLTLSAAQAAGPQFVSDSGNGSTWNTNTAIEYHVESGTCGPFSNEQMLTKLSTLFERWTSLTEVDISVSANTSELDQVGIDNYQAYYYIDSDSSSSTLLTDGINPIIFDEDGTITEELFGTSTQNTLIAKASLNGFDSDFSTITDGQILINCRCLEDLLASYNCLDELSSELIEWDEDQLDAALMREIGRFFNLGYTITESSGYDSTTTEYANLPLLFPSQFNPGTDPEPRQDDVVALARLYPSATLVEDYCLVQGTLLNSSSETLSCINVIATTGLASQTVSQVSGTLSAGTDGNGDGDLVDSGECETNCGYFEFYLQSGLEYSIQIDSVGSSYVDDIAVGPCVNEQLTTGITSATTLATITTSQCTAGTTIDLGNLQTNLSVSAGATSTGSSSDSGGSSSGGSSSGGSSNQTTASSLNGCSLQSDSISSQTLWIWFVMMGGLIVYRIIVNPKRAAVTK